MFKKLLNIILPLAVLAGCNVEEIDQPVDSNREYPDFEAYMDSFGTDTKTAIDKDRNILWKAGDQITIFQKSSVGSQYLLKSGENTTKGSFSYVAPPAPDKNADFTAGTEYPHNVAVSPYSDKYALSQGAGVYTLSNLTVSAVQNYAPDSYDPVAFPMVAVSESSIISFKNAAGMLKLELQGNAVIKSIVLTAQQNICGSAVIKASADNVPVLELSGAQDNAKSVTLTCGEGVQLYADKATVFHIVLPPVDLSEGFQVEIVENGGDHMIMNAPANHPENKIQRNNILKMPVITYQAGILVNISDMIDGGIGF